MVEFFLMIFPFLPTWEQVLEGFPVIGVYNNLHHIIFLTCLINYLCAPIIAFGSYLFYSCIIPEFGITLIH